MHKVWYDCTIFLLITTVTTMLHASGIGVILSKLHAVTTLHLQSTLIHAR